MFEEGALSLRAGRTGAPRSRMITSTLADRSNSDTNSVADARGGREFDRALRQDGRKRDLHQLHAEGDACAHAAAGAEGGVLERRRFDIGPALGEKAVRLGRYILGSRLICRALMTTRSPLIAGSPPSVVGTVALRIWTGTGGNSRMASLMVQSSRGNSPILSIVASSPPTAPSISATSAASGLRVLGEEDQRPGKGVLAGVVGGAEDEAGQAADEVERRGRCPASSVLLMRIERMSCRSVWPRRFSFAHSSMARSCASVSLSQRYSAGVGRIHTCLHGARNHVGDRHERSRSSPNNRPIARCF